MHLNANWHLAHKMPKNPNAKERLEWHVAHAKNCECRKLSAIAIEKLQEAAKKLT